MSGTKGEWKILLVRTRNKPRCLIIDSDGNEVASVNPYRERLEEESRAIAAAPDLLLACKVALSSLRHSGIIGRSPETDTLEAAIQKATGE